MNAVKRLIDELSYWIHIGIADDITQAKEHRPEYQHLVKEVKNRGAPDHRVPRMVLYLLKKESERSFLTQVTFWRCLYLKIRRKIAG